MADCTLGASAVAPQSLLLDNNDFSTGFLSLALLDKDQQHLTMPHSMSLPQSDNHTAPQQAGSSSQGNVKPRIRNRNLRPAPRDTRRQSDQAPTNVHSYPSISSSSGGSFSSMQDREPDLHFDNSPPNSDISSIKSSSPPQSWNADEMQKREKHLERNRAAASKSRQKKKRETDQLKNRFQEVSRRKRLLEEEIKSLHSNLLYLKDQILMHSRCDDEAIHLYLSRMLKQATEHESISSAGGGEDDLRASGSISPTTIQPPQLPPWAEETAGLPCSVENPMMSQMMDSHPAGNIFDYQISI
ncbi:hypothetical protein BJX61DRAFT_535849 [Aspergillus egyptiacus]|nr:hypothetical protein BJX61DRAFT_535849 [Aspergillus egyptiacus]